MEQTGAPLVARRRFALATIAGNASDGRPGQLVFPAIVAGGVSAGAAGRRATSVV